MKDVQVKLLNIKDLNSIASLGNLLNPELELAEVKNSFAQMFHFDTYRCFGLLKDSKIIGISSGWITHRLYSGKQIEVDNVIIDPSIQSKGYGRFFFQKIEEWASTNDCMTIELNTYITNSRSHKFYFNLGYSIIAYHFQKKIK